MTREIKRIDRTILNWIARCENPSHVLNSIIQTMGSRSKKSGYLMVGAPLRAYDTRRDDLQSLIVFDLGTLTGHIHGKNESSGYAWIFGDFSFSNQNIQLPEIVKSQVEGRRLGEIVSYEYLDAEALIVEAKHTDKGMRLNCQEFSIPVEDAHEYLQLPKAA